MPPHCGVMWHVHPLFRCHQNAACGVMWCVHAMLRRHQNAACLSCGVCMPCLGATRMQHAVSCGVCMPCLGATRMQHAVSCGVCMPCFLHAWGANSSTAQPSVPCGEYKAQSTHTAKCGAVWCGACMQQTLGPAQPSLAHSPKLFALLSRRKMGDVACSPYRVQLTLASVPAWRMSLVYVVIWGEMRGAGRQVGQGGGGGRVRAGRAGGGGGREGQSKEGSISRVLVGGGG